MEQSMDFSINELSLFYILTHDCISDWNDFLDSASHSGLERNAILDKLKMANSAARKLRKILTDHGVDVSSLN